jgi:hypothetical protein
MRRFGFVRLSERRSWNAFDGCQIDLPEPDFGDLTFQLINAGVEYLIILLKDIFARPESPEARQPVLALCEGLDLFGLHGSSFSVLAACQLWLLTRLHSVV